MTGQTHQEQKAELDHEVLQQVHTHPAIAAGLQVQGVTCEAEHVDFGFANLSSLQNQLILLCLCCFWLILFLPRAIGGQATKPEESTRTGVDMLSKLEVTPT